MESFSLEEELNNTDNWEYCNEGNNNIVLRYIGRDPILQKKILRIRKNTNHMFYNDDCLIPEKEYNSLFVDKVLKVDPEMNKFLQDMEFVELTTEFMKKIEKKVHH